MVHRHVPLLASAVAVALALGACGGDDDENAVDQRPTAARAGTTNVREQLQRAADRYVAAYRRHDWRAACDVLSPAATRRIRLSARRSSSCADALEELDGITRLVPGAAGAVPRIQVQRIIDSGAMVVVPDAVLQDGVRRDLRFIPVDGSWRIDLPPVD